MPGNSSSLPCLSMTRSWQEAVTWSKRGESPSWAAQKRKNSSSKPGVKATDTSSTSSQSSNNPTRITRATRKTISRSKTMGAATTAIEVRLGEMWLREKGIWR